MMPIKEPIPEQFPDLDTYIQAMGTVLITSSFLLGILRSGLRWESDRSTSPRESKEYKQYRLNWPV